MRIPLLFLISLCSLPFAYGQPAAEGVKPSRQSAGAFLNTSFEVQEKLDAAARLAKENRYSAAAAALQELAVRAGDYLVESSDGGFVTVRRHVHRLMCEWPPEGLEAAEQAIGPSARERLSRARQRGSIPDLLSVSDDSFVTSAGAEALDEAAELALSAGDLRAARRWWTELFLHHPARQQSGLRWRAKAACAAAWEGDRAALQKLADELSASGGPTVFWAGREQLLRDFLRDVERDLKEGAPIVADDFAGLPGAFAGGNDRRGASRTTARAEARLWRFTEWNRVPLESAFEGYESSVARRDAMLRAVQSGRQLATTAVAGELPSSGGKTRIFLHDASSAWSIDPDDPGAAVWRFNIAGADAGPTSWMSEEDTPPQYTSLVADGRLYVHLDRPVTRPDADPGTMAAVLVCLDAATGQLIWRNDLEGLVSDFEQLRLDGAPLKVDDKLFAVARRRKPFGFEACHLLRLDATSGALESSTHIAEAATGSYGYHRATLTHAAAWGDLIFVGTNLGAIAAISRHTGRVEWLATYLSQYTEAPEGLWPTRMGRPARSWHYQAAMIWRDSVIVAPLDAEQILVYDVMGGKERFRISLESLHMPELVLGVAGDRLYLAGSQVVCYDLAARRIDWQRPLDAGQIFGRGAVTSAGLFIPTDRALVRMSLDGGPPTSYRWSVEEAGNVTVLADQIIAASALSVSGLVSHDAAVERIAARMRERPDDARPALAMAELALSTGDFDASITATKEAIRRMGGLADLPDEASRRRLFEQLTLFATTALGRTAAASGPATAHIETAVAFLELAGTCATGPEQQADWRFQLAHARRRLRQPREAAEVYQQILSDRALRAARLEIESDLLPPAREGEPIGESQVARQPAGYIAELCIERIMQESGREAYESIEQRARERLAIAAQSPDASVLLELAAAFPNSESAPAALRRFASLAARQGDWSDATDALRRCLRRAADTDRPAVMLELIDALIAAGKPRAAGQWLTRAIRDFPDYRFEKSGESQSFAAWGRAALGERFPRDPAHDIAVAPAGASYSRVFNDHVAVLDPTFARLPHTTWDAVVTYSDGRLEARIAATGRALWPQPAVITVQPTLLGMDESRYVFTTPHRVLALTRSSGQQAWAVGEEAGADPLSDPEESATFSSHCLTPSRLYSANDRGELLAIDLADGAIRWRASIRLPVGGQLAANEKYVCHTAWQDKSQSIVVLDARTGQIVSTLRPGDDWPVQAIAATDDSKLIAVTSNAVTAFDLASGTATWTIGSDDRFLIGSLQFDDEGILISNDGRRISKYDLRDGLPIWTSQPLAESSGDGIWTEVSDGWLLAASADRLTALDTADGRTLWTAATPGLLRIEPPRIARDCVVALVEAGAAEARAEFAAFGSLTGEAPSAANKKSERDRSRYLRIVGYDLASGEPKRIRAMLPTQVPATATPSAPSQPVGEAPAITSASIVSDSLSSFGGVCIRDRAIILLDGRRMICYVARDE